MDDDYKEISGLGSYYQEEYIKLKRSYESLKEENTRLQSRLVHAIKQWNIWCKAYNELVDQHQLRYTIY